MNKQVFKGSGGSNRNRRSADTLNLLYVDEPEATETVSARLERRNDRFIVSTATSVDEAIQKLSEQDIDCVVSEYDMPERDGIEFLRQVRDVPFILYTEAGSEQVASEAIAAGVTDYLQKKTDPGEDERLAVRVAAAVNEHRMEQDGQQLEGFRKLIRASVDILTVLNASGRVEFNSQAVEPILGYSQGELVGESLFEYVHPDDQEQARDAFDHVLADPDAVGTSEFRVQHADGSWVWFESRVTNRLEDPHIEGVVVNQRKITERKQRMRKLERENVVFQKASIGIFVVNDAGEYTNVNRAACEMVGYTREELLSMTIADIGDIEGSPDDDSLLQELKDTGRVRAETTLMHKDGHKVDVLFDGVAFGDGRFVAYCQDISEQNTLQAEVTELSERLDLALEAGQLGVWDWDIRTDEVTFDERWAEMLGYSLDEIEPHLRAWESRVHPDDLPKAEAALKEHFAGEADYYQSVHRLETKSGDWIWVRDVGKVVERGEDGEPTRAVGIHQDVTQQKTHEKQLEDQRDYLNVLNQMLRHDIRNDLQLVSAYAELITKRTDDEEVESHVETILENTEHAVELTATAREIANLTDTDEVELRPIGLRTVLETELDAVRSAYPEAVLRGPDNPPAVRVRATDMLNSVFRNLLKNAIQHNDTETTEVTVSATEREETMLVRVADNGPGIPDTQKDSVFGKGESGLESHGTGMGLYLVQTLIESYGGSVRVEDNEPRGAKFVIELPKAQ